MHVTKKMVHGKWEYGYRYARYNVHVHVQILNTSVILSLLNFSGILSYIELKEKFQYIEEASKKNEWKIL